MTLSSSIGERLSLRYARNPLRRSGAPTRRAPREIDPRARPNPEGAMPIKRGEVYWIQLDHPEATNGGVPHPHVVIQDDVLNESRIETVVVCALTSNLGRAEEPGNVLLEEGEGELPRRSVIVVSQVSSVGKRELGERIGALDERRVQQIFDGLRFQQRSFFRDEPRGEG